MITFIILIKVNILGFVSYWNSYCIHISILLIRHVHSFLEIIKMLLPFIMLKE